VIGVAVSVGSREVALSAPIVIAADGRHSTLSFGLGLARHPPSPRRWAIGAYFEDFLAPIPHARKAIPTPCRENAEAIPVQCPGNAEALAAGTLGEMHVRRGRYIGVASMPGGLANVCVVRASGPADPELADPRALLARELARDPVLRDRAAGARLVTTPVVLGPLAVDPVPSTVDGLILAGDAAGFIDPMTGDGLRFAVRGGELAASAALDVLAHGWAGAHARLAAARRREFANKWRFNRALRALVGSPRALDAATIGARVAPAVFRAVIAHAGDCHAAC
jgi:flavin-dependent dehydrogenase